MGNLQLTTVLSTNPEGVIVQVKIVPRASKSRIAGILGGRLKILVAAPPEDGKANQAVCLLLAETLGIPSRDVIVEAGHTQPQKRLLLRGISLCRVTERMKKYLE
ncbi:MAG: DUF167 domain-containing protein [Phycisphaeraceae bacterium]|nr:DUF167 domain-containing protein [Phycisphaeraceae bacterium]